MALWTAEQDEALRELYPTLPNAEIAKIISERFGTERSSAGVLGRAKKLGLSKDKAAGYVKRMPHRFWTDERREWFIAFVPGHTEPEISAEHERIFGIPLSEGQIGNAKKTFGVKSGTHGGRYEKGMIPTNKGKTWDEIGVPQEVRDRCRATQFKPGHRPHNQRERLDERKDRDGYWFVKVDPRNAKNTMGLWISKAKFEWMKANGQDWPKGHKALLIDGDKDNCTPENVYPVPNELWPMVMGAVGPKIEYWDRESLETAILCAKISSARYRARKGSK